MVGQFAFDLRLGLGDLVIDAILFLVSELPRLVELRDVSKLAETFYRALSRSLTSLGCAVVCRK